MTFPFPPGGGGFPPGPPGGGGFPPGPPGGGFPGGGGGGQLPPPPGPPPLGATPMAPRRHGFRVDAGSIRPCRFRFVYIWLHNGRAFWFYPIFVSRNTAAGYRWNGFSWQYFGLDLNRVAAFECF